MSELHAIALFHLNLAFSSIEEEQRPEVVKSCYWPLLRLPVAIQAPIAIEATGYTLEVIAAIDPNWIIELRRLISIGAVEFVGSGYAQLIGPLVPAQVNEANLAFGHACYERLLGVRPTIALVNEQAYSAGLVPLYLDAGYSALMADWDNVAAHHPDWPLERRYHPQRVRGVDGRVMPLLWTHTMAFQKLQRLAHGDIVGHTYTQYVEAQRSILPRLMTLYSNDAEVFDFRPKRFHTEERMNSGEWQLIADLWGQFVRDQRVRFVTPSQAIGFTDHPEANHEIELQTAAYPVPVKKQKKYNITRWAVSGRDDLAINATCFRIYNRLMDMGRAEASWWRELCYLWSSDFRTHITEKRWNAYRARLETMERAVGATLPSPSAFAPALPSVRSGKWLEIETQGLCAVLNRRRGLAIHSLSARGDNRPAMLTSLLHGYYEPIELQFDWYCGNLTFEAPGSAKVTDLDWVTPHVYRDEHTGDTLVEGTISTSLGPIQKRLRLAYDRPRIEFDIQLHFQEWGRGSLRMGNFLLNPEAFNRDALWYRAHQGGRQAERFGLNGGKIDHGKPISFLVSASTGIGMSEGVIEVGDDERSIRVEADQGVSPMIGLMHHEYCGDSFFSRLSLSGLELDDTRKPGLETGPRQFKFAVSLQS